MNRIVAGHQGEDGLNIGMSSVPNSRQKLRSNAPSPWGSHGQDREQRAGRQRGQSAAGGNSSP
jgi:hypothetical protein